MFENMKSESVYIGYDLKKFNEIRDALDHAHLAYKYHTRNHQGQFLAPGRGTIRTQFGSAGMDSAHMYEYEIKVSAKNREKAAEIIRSL